VESKLHINLTVQYFIGYGLFAVKVDVPELESTAKFIVEQFVFVLSILL
jgi:hypothetical protein